MKKRFYLIFALSLVVIGVVALFAGNISDSIHFASGNACDHVGYHYNANEPSDTVSGNREFWACCKCHQTFLSEPLEGSFTTRPITEALGFDENHEAYLRANRKVTVTEVSYIELGDNTKVQAGLSQMKTSIGIDHTHEITTNQTVAIAGVNGTLQSLKIGSTAIESATYADGSLTFAKSSIEKSYGLKNLTAVIFDSTQKQSVIVTIPAYVCDFAIKNANDLDAMQYVANKFAGQTSLNATQSGNFVLANDIVYNAGAAVAADKINSYANLRQYSTVQNSGGDYWSGGFSGQFEGLGHNIEGLVIKEKTGMTGLFYILAGNTGYIKNLSFTHAVALGHGFLVGRLTDRSETAVMEHIAVQLDFMKGGKKCGADCQDGSGLVPCGRNTSYTYVGDVFVKLDDYIIPSGSDMYGPFVWGADSVDGYRCVCDLELPMQRKGSGSVEYCKDKPTAAFATYAAFKKCDKYGHMATSCATFWNYMNSTYVNYTVKFMNGETELQSDSIEYAQLPVYKGAEPVSPISGVPFVGWDKEIVPVNGDTTYYARFEKVFESKQAVFNRDISAGAAAYRTASGNTSYLDGYTWDENYASFDVTGIGNEVTSVKVGTVEKLTDAIVSGSTLQLPMSLFATDGSTGTITVLSNTAGASVKHVISYTAADFVVMTADDLDAMQYIANKFTAKAHPYGAGYIVLGQDITYNTGAAVVADKANNYANLRQYDTVQGSDYWSGGLDGTFNGLGHNIEGLVMKAKSGMTGLFYILNTGKITNFSVTHGVALGHGFIVGRQTTGISQVEHIAVQLDYMGAGTSTYAGVDRTGTNGMFCHPATGSNSYVGDIFVQIDEYKTPGEGETLPYVMGPVNPDGCGFVVPDLNIRLWNTSNSSTGDVYASAKPAVTFTSYSAFKTGSAKYGKLATVCSAFWAYMENTYGI